MDWEKYLQPLDVHNRELVQNVHPVGWQNPEPRDRYHLVVVGAGTAGLVSAAIAAALGARVALIERRFMGGDCLNYGCVPSKAILRSARVVAEIRRAPDHGIRPGDPVEVDFAAVMERMRRLRAGISYNDSAARFRDLGVDVFLGEARFTGRDRVRVGDVELRFRRAILATGARPVEPAIPGLAEAGYYTNETVFTMTERPRRLVVIGGGPIGCELSQAFQRLGCEVTVIEMADHLLPREDPDAAAILARSFEAEGIRVLLKHRVVQVTHEGDEKRVHIERDGHVEMIPADAILVGAGRAPNVENMGLEAAGVKYDPRHGVVVNDRLQTTNPRIFAADDVCLRFKFTHSADATARIAVQNALFFGRKKLSTLVIPWCTYTDLEIAHVGMYPKDAEQRGVPVRTFTVSFDEVDRAVLDGEEDGFVRVHVKKGSDQILGATIVARHAGEMISEITTAMVHGIGLGGLAQVIHPYPTQAEAIRKAGDLYNRTRLTPRAKRLFRLWFRLFG